MRSFQPAGFPGRLRYHDLPGGGAPLVFIHGLGCASSCDYPQVACDPALSTRRRILVDLPGSGFSDRPAGFSYSIDALAALVAELAASLGSAQVDLFGHSMGGAVAICAAVLLGTRLHHLVLGEPNLDPGGGAFSRAIAAFSEEEYLRRGHADVVEDARRQGNFTWAASLELTLPAAVHRESVSLVRGSFPAWRRQLADLPAPRCVLFGEHSLPDPDLPRLQADGISTRVVPGCGHSMAWENPSGLAGAIAAALE